MKHAQFDPIDSSLVPIEALSTFEALAIHIARACMEDETTAFYAENVMGTALGPVQGRKALRAATTVVEAVACNSARQLMRRRVGCRFANADERWFARFVDLASDGDREAAIYLALGLLPSPLAFQVIDPARRFGLALRRVDLILRNQSLRRMASRTLN